MTTLAELIRAGFRSVAIDVTGVVIDANSRFAQKSEVTDLSNKVTSLESDKADASAVDGKLDKTGTAYKTASIPFVIPNETEATAALTATCAEITSLYNGLLIAFRLPFSNVASTTLDINGFGAKPVYYQATTTSASRIIANSVVILVYETVTMSSGCWKAVCSYQTDNTARQYQSVNNVDYPILARYNTTDKTSGYDTSYARYAMNVTLNPSTGAITAPGGILDASGQEKYVSLSGSRGQIGGSEVAAVLTGSQTITVDSADTTVISASGAVTLSFTAADPSVCATKVIALNALQTSTLTFEGAVWSNNGAAPTQGTAGKNLVLIAHFINGRVVLNVFDNDEL